MRSDDQLQQHPADLGPVLDIIEGEMNHGPTHSCEERISVQSVTEFLAVHVFDMALIAVALNSKTTKWSEERKVEELRFAIPVEDLIFRMQVVEVSE
ncbi:hypothetical protein [Paenibacillus alginolyticus]|uniref:hypothetical protein n=1 Tax=Paenibacillus alginolyticus TaxID=59839 RepID=UPI001566487D